MTAEVIGGYRLVNAMWTGQTSQVWQVVEVTSQRHFAMKILLPEYGKDAEQRRFLTHEADVGLELTHPNIIKIVLVARDKTPPYFVMEYFPSGNLKRRIMGKEHDFIKEKSQDILKQAATGLAFMHAMGYIHRDIKPENILVSSAGDVRIIDFALAYKIPTGLAKLFARKGKTQGTHSYMSPEQIRGQVLDPRADIYSFGASAYELVTGRPPFRGSSKNDLLNKHLYEKPISPKVHNPDVTDEFAGLVMNMLAKKRDERPPDFHQVLIKLRSIRVFKSQAPQKRGDR